MKRMLSFFMVLALLVSMIPAGSVSVWAATTVASGTCGDNLTWTLDDEGALTISGSGAMYNYGVSAPWYSRKNSVKKVVVCNGVTTIGSTAFHSCSNLKSVELPDSVTTIDDHAFYGCSSLTDINIPNYLTTIGDRVFSGCTSLTSVNIPDTVTAYGVAIFTNCSSLTSVDIPDFVTTFGEFEFYFCTSLTALDIPDSVTSIGNFALAGCSGLTSVEIPASVSIMGDSVFAYSDNLVEIQVNNNNNSFCDIDGVLFTKDQKTLIHYPAKRTDAFTVPASVTTICNKAFEYARIEEIYFDGSAPAMGEKAFDLVTAKAYYYPDDTWTEDVLQDYGGNITWIALEKEPEPEPNPEPEIVTSGKCGDNVTWSLYNSGTIILSGTGAMYDYWKWPDYVLSPWYDQRSSIKKVIIQSGVTSIGSASFLECENLLSAEISSSIISIGDNAFAVCNKLTNVNIPSSVTSIGEAAFGGCTSLTELIFEGSAPSIADSAFNGMTAKLYYYADETWGDVVSQDYGDGIVWVSLESESEVISSGVCGYDLTWTLDDHGVLTISGTGTMYDFTFEGSPWFDYRSSIKQVIVETGVSSIGAEAFGFCDKLSSISIPESVTKIGGYAFRNCSSLAVVEIPASVTSVIGNSFIGCAAEIQVDPENKTYSDIDGVLFNYAQDTLIRYPGGRSGEYTIPNGVVTIEYSAFCECTGLTGITMPDSVATIEGYAFSGCINLLNVKLSNSLAVINRKTFDTCVKLTYIVIPDSVVTIEDESFFNCYGLKYIEIGAAVSNFGPLSICGSNHMEKITVDSENQYYCDIDGILFSKDKSALIYWPNGKTGEYSVPESVTSIGNSAFVIGGLNSVEIPSSVITIGYNAFSMSSVDEIYFEGSAPTIGDDTFYCVTATAYYYPDETWTEDVMQDYGGRITWVARECQHSYSSVVTAPTCTEQGYTTHTCIKCGDSYKDTYVDASGHSYGDWEMVDDTNHKRTCTVCKTATESKPHNYSSVVTPPTCTERGYTTHTCPDCSHVFKDSNTDPADHTFGDDNVCDACGYLLGDFTGDGKVTADDVQHLLWYTVFPADYPLNGPADFDGDGVVTDKDVLLLLLYITLPALFPLPQLT